MPKKSYDLDDRWRPVNSPEKIYTASYVNGREPSSVSHKILKSLKCFCQPEQVHLRCEMIPLNIVIQSRKQKERKKEENFLGQSGQHPTRM